MTLRHPGCLVMDEQVVGCLAVAGAELGQEWTPSGWTYHGHPAVACTCLLAWDPGGVEHPLHLVGAHGHDAQCHDLGKRPSMSQTRAPFPCCALNPTQLTGLISSRSSLRRYMIIAWTMFPRRAACMCVFLTSTKSYRERTELAGGGTDVHSSPGSPCLRTCLSPVQPAPSVRVYCRR